MKYSRAYIAGALLAVLVIAGGLVAAPFLIANATVKSDIATRLAAITGGSVHLPGTPSVSLWPYLSITYRNMLLAAPTPDGEPLARVETLTVKLAFWPALSGRTVIDEIELVRPIVSLPDPDMTSVFERMWQHTVLEPALTSSQISIIVRDGIVVPALAPPSGDERLTGLTGVLSPSSGGRGGTFDVQGVWHGQTVGLKGSVGTNNDSARAPVELAVTSAPLGFTLSGIAETAAGFAFEGSVSFESPSLKHTAQWLGLPDAEAAPALPLTMNGTMSRAGPAARITDVSLISGDWSASGRLDLGLRDHGVSVDGTLAMNGLTVLEDDATFETALVTLAGQETAVFDLRFSAPVASYGTWAFTDLAGGIRVVDGQAHLDIGSAESAGGGLTGQVSYSADGSRKSDVALTNMDLATLAALVESSPFRPTGKVDVTLGIVRRGRDGSLQGTFSMEAQDGRLEGFDAQHLLTGDQPANPLDGSTAFSALSVSGRMENDTLIVEKADLQNSDLRMTASGQTNVATRTLEFLGTIEPTGDAPGKRRFAFGGTLDELLHTPLSPRDEIPATPIR